MKTDGSGGGNNLDWRKIAAVDISTFAATISANDEYLHEITTCLASFGLDNEFAESAIDSNFRKLFRMSQLIMAHLIGEYERMRRMEADMKSCDQTAIENRKLRKLLQIHQSAFSYHAQNGNSANSELQCPHCPKAFYDIAFLQSHLERRHSALSQCIAAAADPLTGLSLSQRINDYQSLYARYKDSDALSDELNAVKQKLDAATQDLIAERNARMQLEQDMEAKVRDVQESVRMQTGCNLFAPISISDCDSDTAGDRAQSPLPAGTNIEKIMLFHTQEVQKLGNNIQILANKIAETYAAKSPPPSAMVVDRAARAALSPPTELEPNVGVSVVKERVDTTVKHDATASDRMSASKRPTAAISGCSDKAAPAAARKVVAAKECDAVNHDDQDDAASEQQLADDDAQLTAEEINNYVADVMTMLGVPQQATAISNELYAHATGRFKTTYVESDASIKQNINHLVSEEARKQHAQAKRQSKQHLSLKLRPSSARAPPASASRASDEADPANERVERSAAADHDAEQSSGKQAEPEEISEHSELDAMLAAVNLNQSQQPTSAAGVKGEPRDRKGALQQQHRQFDQKQRKDELASPTPQSTGKPAALRSVLKKDAGAAAGSASNNNTPPKGSRRISFSETRVEISPEQSDMSDFENIDLTPSPSGGGSRKTSMISRQENVVVAATPPPAPPAPTPRPRAQAQPMKRATLAEPEPDIV